MIDTGDGESPEYLELLEKVLRESQVTVGEIVLTHWHGDHVGGIGPVRKSIGQECRAWKFPRDTGEDGYTELADGQEIETEGASLK